MGTIASHTPRAPFLSAQVGRAQCSHAALPAPAFTKFDWNAACPHIAYGCFFATVLEWGNCDGGRMVQEAQNIDWLLIDVFSALFYN